jgi:hypothetical protein
MMNKPQKRSSAAIRIIGYVAADRFLSIIISAQVALAEGYTGKGSGIGAFMGLVFGDHPRIVAEGAITGAVVGGVVQQAGIECDKIDLGMRQERRELGLGPCRY